MKVIVKPNSPLCNGTTVETEGGHSIGGVVSIDLKARVGGLWEADLVLHPKGIEELTAIVERFKCTDGRSFIVTEVPQLNDDPDFSHDFEKLS